MLKVVADVKLEESDVNLIAAEERETGKPAQPPKKPRVGKRDLPIVLATDHNIWSQELLPALYDWCGTREEQFRLNSDKELRPTLRSLWIHFFGGLSHLPDTYKDNTVVKSRSDHPAIYSYVCNFFSVISYTHDWKGTVTNPDLSKQTGRSCPWNRAEANGGLWDH